MIENQALRPLLQGFTKKYPFLTLSYLRADDGVIISKIDAEERGAHPIGDVVEGTGVSNAAGGQGLLQAYFTPLIDKYPAAYHDRKHIWAPTRISYFGTAYNTKAVKPDQIPNTYEDLLKPVYKGKLSWRTEALTGAPLFITNLRLAWGEEKAMAYFRELAKQEIVDFSSGSARTLVDRVIAGEYAFALQIFSHHPLISAAKGAPTWTKLMDPTVSAASTIGIVKGAPHPNASLLLIDFILSDEGQKILSDAEYFPADPDVAPKANLEPATPRHAGVKESFVSPEKMVETDQRSEQIYKDLFRK
jgi:iron(III) transport system substrate-binding protein